MSDNKVFSGNHNGRNLPQTAWVPGQSGNPGGRPKELVHVRDAARQHTEAAITTLARIMADETEKASARVAAAEALLDRAWGKPTQPMEIDARMQQEVLPRDVAEARLREMGVLPPLALPPAPAPSPDEEQKPAN